MLLQPTGAQLDRLQTLCQAGAGEAEIAADLGIPRQLLQIWGRREDEAGDAIRVGRAIRNARRVIRSRAR